MINKVRIENFRSIKSQEIELKNYTLIIGDNGKGKTSVLEAINYALPHLIYPAGLNTPIFLW